MRFFIFCLLVLLGSGSVLCQNDDAQAQRAVTEETVVDFHLNFFIARMVKEAEEAGILDTLSDALKRCYEKIANNYYTLSAEDVLQAMPEILQYAMTVERTKAWRPTAPFAETAPVVGPASQTNPSLYSLLQMLVAIKKRLDCLGNEITECCACDFFITQDATGGRNHPVNDPITEPGVYCLAEDVTGSIVIETSNVTILFNGHTLTTATTADTGILSNGNSHIRINGGTITGADLALDIQDGLDVEVEGMTFTSNTTSLSLISIQRFIIERCQFVANLDNDMVVSSCSYGTIASCFMTGSLDTNYVALTLGSCLSVACNDIVIARNTAALSFTGINGVILNQCVFKNVQIISNSITTAVGTVTSFYGMRLTRAENCMVVGCAVNNNTITKTGGNSATFVGFEAFAAGQSTGNNNQFIDCQVHGNTVTGAGIPDARFIGINIGGTISGNTTAPNGTLNNVVQGCSVNNNSQTTTSSGNAYMVGINCGGTLVEGTVSLSSCLNCVFDACTVNNNTNTAAGSAHFAGFNMGSAVGGGSIEGFCCTDTIINGCTVNANRNASASVANIAVGINLAGFTTVQGQLQGGICTACSIKNCTINFNIGSSSAAVSNFCGINCSGVADGSGIGAFRGESCDACVFSDIQISGNRFDGSSVFRGIYLNGASGTLFAGGCNDIVLDRCIINDNSLAQNSNAFAGFVIDGTTATSRLGGANGIRFTGCEVGGNNINSGTSQAYLITGDAQNPLAGAKDIQFQGCNATSNRFVVSSVLTDGFVFESIRGALLQQCVSSSHGNHGYRFVDSVNSAGRECQATGNDGNGFSLEGSTNNVTLVGCQSLGNGTDGFDFINTTTQCHIRQNIAQNNTNIGFNNEDGDLFKHQFVNNYAQANGTNYSGVPIVVNPYTDPAPLNPFGNVES